MDSVASTNNSLEGGHAHAINTRPSFLPRGAGSEARFHSISNTYSTCVTAPLPFILIN